MSNETQAEKQKRWLPAVLAGLVLIGIAAWVSALLPQDSKTQETPIKQSAQQILREWNGQIALFEGDTAEPTEVYEVTVATLPEEEQQRLQSGIVIYSEEMLAELLDNYTS